MDSEMHPDENVRVTPGLSDVPPALEQHLPSSTLNGCDLVRRVLFDWTLGEPGAAGSIPVSAVPGGQDRDKTSDESNSKPLENPAFP